MCRVDVVISSIDTSIAAWSSPSDQLKNNALWRSDCHIVVNKRSSQCWSRSSLWPSLGHPMESGTHVCMAIHCNISIHNMRQISLYKWKHEHLAKLNKPNKKDTSWYAEQIGWAGQLTMLQLENKWKYNVSRASRRWGSSLSLFMLSAWQGGSKDPSVEADSYVNMSLRSPYEFHPSRWEPWFSTEPDPEIGFWDLENYSLPPQPRSCC